MSEILGVIVSYNPEIEKFNSNIIAIKKQVDKLVLLDNNSENKNEIENLCLSLGITFILENENLGLGKAYNKILSMYLTGYHYFVTFDQDTYIPDNTLSILKNVLNNNLNIGVIGPLFSRSIAKINENVDLKFKDVIIQSCALFRADLFTEIGGFNERYFVDLTDFEYCLRIRKYGLKVAIFPGIQIYHELGEIKTFRNREVIVHSNLRNYYLARNHVDLCKRFLFNFPLFIVKINFFYIIKIFEISFIERDFKKLKYILKGLLGLKL